MVVYHGIRTLQFGTRVRLILSRTSEGASTRYGAGTKTQLLTDDEKL